MFSSFFPNLQPSLRRPLVKLTRKPFLITLGAFALAIVGWFTVFPIGIPVSSKLKMGDLDTLGVVNHSGDAKISIQRILWRTPWQGFELGFAETTIGQSKNGRFATHAFVTPHLVWTANAKRYKLCLTEVNYEGWMDRRYSATPEPSCFEAWERPAIELSPTGHPFGEGWFFYQPRPTPIPGWGPGWYEIQREPKPII